MSLLQQYKFSSLLREGAKIYEQIKGTTAITGTNKRCAVGVIYSMVGYNCENPSPLNDSFQAFHDDFDHMNEKFSKRYNGVYIAGMNDKYNKSFEEIADMIEEIGY